MATAVEPSSQARTPTTQSGRALAGLAGGVYVLAALAVVFYAIPMAVEKFLPDALWVGFFRWLAMVGAVYGLYRLGVSLAGTSPPKGIRGGITLWISALIATFFIARAVGLGVETLGSAGLGLTLVVAGGMLFATFRLLASPRGERWMVGLEDTGLMSGTTYKRALGQKVRRLTILGLLLVGGTGAYTLHNTLGSGDWVITLPFTQADGAADGVQRTFTLVPMVNYTLPSLLFALTLWVGFRAVNVPAFAEFLIATEAEMNKVSWTTRRRLFQDTLVVLVTTLLLTLFLLVVDLFWGWLLSREIVGVLPGRSTDSGKAKVQEARW